MGASPSPTSDEKKLIIAEHFKAIMETLGLDLTDDSLCDTPKRVAKMYVDEIFYGLDEKAFPRMMAVENKFKYDQAVIERDIAVKSVCEHHFQPIVGVAHIAYIPKDKVIGLSKLNRIVDYFSRRPQVQERLTEVIHARLCKELETEDVAVIIDAKHFCIVMRGVNDHASSTVTSKMSGAFMQQSARSEVISLISHARGL